MPAVRKNRIGPARRSERGQALLIFLVLAAIAAAAILYGSIRPAAGSIARDTTTTTALAQAKDALLGRAVGDANRPGSLPCPDTNNDGSAELFAGSGCPSYIGRLPWRTLGLPDPRDQAGERLWYALFPVFRDNTAGGLLDVDTKGGLTVYLDSTGSVMTTEAVAVIIAPGASVPGQVRNTAGENNPANYLDATAGVNNALATGPFISAQVSPVFNDRLLFISTADLMPLVEKRVAREMLALLNEYRAKSACGCYPWAANNFDDDSVDGRRRGGVPIENALPENWGSGAIPSVPAWMIGSNEWGKRLYYAVARDKTAAPAAGTLTLNGVSKDVIILTPGPAGAGRPSANLTDYLDDPENTNNDDIFQIPPSTAYTRDRIYALP